MEEDFTGSQHRKAGTRATRSAEIHTAAFWIG